MNYKVVGLGNPLMGDDAFGLFVLEELKKIDFKKKVTLYYLPTPSPWQIYEVLLGGGDFIIVDVFEKGTDGIIEVFPLSELSKGSGKFKTVHDININQVIDLLRLNEKEVKGFVVGTKGYNFNISLNLSERLEKLVLPCVKKIIEIIER
ncbi:MAG: hydrogenase maturation protease [Proteobacteria bacterium]|nr:hydrogenase maturation protease [Pseudomonadota bacterium]